MANSAHLIPNDDASGQDQTEPPPLTSGKPRESASDAQVIPFEDTDFEQIDSRPREADFSPESVDLRVASQYGVRIKHFHADNGPTMDFLIRRHSKTQ